MQEQVDSYDPLTQLEEIMDLMSLPARFRCCIGRQPVWHPSLDTDSEELTSST